MAYPHGFLDDIRARISTSEIVAKHVQLKKRGREWVGLSPFKSEKTPSFTVNDDKGFYHCFASGEHGDIFTFLMRMEGLSFPESVEQLAERVGLEIPQQTPQQQAKERNRLSLYDLAEETCKYFQTMLYHPSGKPALDYLRNRGLNDAMITNFRLGYAPKNGDELKAKLKNNDYSDQQMQDAGIFRPSNDGRKPYAFFRERIIFPISDRRGRTIAFGGRFMGDAKLAQVGKYINSPDSSLFDKGRILYNMAEARKFAHNGETVIIVEGYMDVIALSKAGFNAALAPLGTALTLDQIIEIWRIDATPCLCFDGDSAGKKAAIRAAEHVFNILETGKSLKFIFMPDGEDPDSFLAAYGQVEMQKLIDGAIGLDQFIWQSELAKVNINTPEAKALLEKNIMQYVGRIDDKILAKYYRQSFSDKLWQRFRKISFLNINKNKNSYKKTYDRQSSAPKADAPSGNQLLLIKQKMPERQQQILLACLINHPKLIDRYEEVFEQFNFQTKLDKIRLQLQEITSSGLSLDIVGLRDYFINNGNADLLAHVLNEQVYLLAPQAKASATDDDACQLLEHILLLQTQIKIADEISIDWHDDNGQLDNDKEIRKLAVHAQFIEGEEKLLPSENSDIEESSDTEEK